MDVVNLLYLVKVLESYYPETLGTMYVSNAPWIFWGFWKGVKNLLDPVVRDKIKFISTPADTEGDVPADYLIKFCGGSVTSEFKYVDPKEDENDAQKDTATKERLLKQHRALTDKFEEVTRAWCKADGKDDALQEQRAVLCKKLRLSQFELEPYTRGLSVYHRNGVLPVANPGISAFDYEVPGSPTRRQVLGRKTCRKSIEQQLVAISKGKKVSEAEAETAEALKSGSWGDWRVNDNSDEIKKGALATLTDLGETKPSGDAQPVDSAAPTADNSPAGKNAQSTETVPSSADAPPIAPVPAGDTQPAGLTAVAASMAAVSLAPSEGATQGEHTTIAEDEGFVTPDEK